MTKEATVAAIAAIMAINGMIFYVSGGFTGMVTDNGMATDTGMATEDPHALQIPEYEGPLQTSYQLLTEPPTLYQKAEAVGDPAINLCQDTDNGITPAIAGSVTVYNPDVGNVVYSDVCVSGLVGAGEEADAYVKEYYCVSIGAYTRMFLHYLPCEKGCVNGACQ